MLMAEIVTMIRNKRLMTLAGVLLATLLGDVVAASPSHDKQVGRLLDEIVFAKTFFPPG